MSTRPQILAVGFGLAAAALVALIIVSSLQMSLWAGLNEIVSTWWGITTLVDVYIGLIFVAVWIGVLERRTVPIVAWTLALLLLGNLATAVYVANRARKARTLADVFLPRRAPATATPSPAS